MTLEGYLIVISVSLVVIAAACGVIVFNQMKDG